MSHGPADTPRSADAVAFFDASAVDYEDKHYQRSARSFMTVRQARVLEFVDRCRLPAGAAVLDAGCGPGHIVAALAKRGFRVSALDGAEGMLREARARAEAVGPAYPVEFRQGDIERMPFPDASFDLVCSTGVIEYLPEDATVLREFHRLLRPGGRLLLPVTNDASPALWLDRMVEAVKRTPWLLAPINAIVRRLGGTPVLPRHFTVRRHRVGPFLDAVRAAGFKIEDGVFFYLLPWPRPFDQFFPRATAALGERLERRAKGPVGRIGEGYLVLAVK